MADNALRPVPNDGAHPWANDVNPIIYGLNGNLGIYVRLRGFSGNRVDPLSKAVTANSYAIDAQAANGLNAGFPLLATDPTATLTAANSAALIREEGVWVGAGKGLRLYGVAGTSYASLVGDNTGLATLGGSGAGSGQLSISALIAATIGPNASQQHTIPAVTSDTLALLAATQAFTNKSVSLQNGLVGTPSLSFTGQATDGLYWISAGRVGHTLGGTKVLEVVNSGGTFGLGIGASPSVALTVTRNVADYLATLTNANAGGRGISVVTGGTGATDALLSLFSNTNTERFSVYADGVINAASGQIKFPATQAPSSDANTLDDYEEGAWTPTVGGNSVCVSTGIYVKIGRQVTVWCDLTVTTRGTGSQSTISGLPFASDMNAAGVVSVFLNLSVAVTSLFVETNSAATMFLRGLTAAATSSGTVNGIQDTTFIRATLTYRTAN